MQIVRTLVRGHWSGNIDINGTLHDVLDGWLSVFEIFHSKIFAIPASFLNIPTGI